MAKYGTAWWDDVATRLREERDHYRERAYKAEVEGDRLRDRQDRLRAAIRLAFVGLAQHYGPGNNAEAELYRCLRSEGLDPELL